MPVESPPERGAIWLENWILASTIASITSQQVNYPASNLLNQLRSDRWWSTALGDCQIGPFDVGSVKTPTCFGLVESNIDAGSTFALIGSDDAAVTTNVVAWYFSLYAQDAVGKLLKWYPGTPTVGTIGPSTNPADAASARGRRYWCIRLLPSFYSTTYTADDHYQIGVPWLGQYVSVRPWEGIRMRPKDPSTRTLSYGRAQWSDPKTPYREAEVPLGGLTMAQFYDLEAKVRAQGTTAAVLDIHAFSTDPILKRGGALYGYFADNPCDGSISSLEDNELNLNFEEASG